MILDLASTLHGHVRGKTVSACTAIVVIRYLSKYVSRDVLDQMEKLYVLLHLDWGDIIHHHIVDSEWSPDFTKKVKAIQYSVRLVISGVWRGANKCKLYDELGWENFYHTWWYRGLTHFFKLRQSRSPLYLYILIPSEREVNCNLRRVHVFDQRVE